MHFLDRMKHRAPAGAALLVAMLFVAAPALAITVQINGNTVALNPTPIERAGRVFVPLRGVFEQLGATVVYSNGQINATSGRHTVSLNIGSTQATVDGQQQTLDVAPFIIGASTYVPLRFVSQALGAQVNWDQNDQLVMVTQNGPRGGNQYAGNQNGGNPYVGGPNRTVPQENGNLLSSEFPQNGQLVRSMQPRIAARFSDNVDPNSLQIRLDGVDITAAARLTQGGFEYVPPSPLQPMTHTVRIRGRDLNGQAVYATWTFSTSNGM